MLTPPAGSADAPLAELHTLVDFVRWGASRFAEARLCFSHGTDNAIDEALALVLHALALPHGLPAELMHARLTRAEKSTVAGFIERRLRERVPVPYLTHEAWFAGLRFYVDERVLIPRSPIAELIEAGFSPWVEATRVRQVLDLCTGSGCIAIACAHAFPEAQVQAVDISADALAVAAINVRDHELEGRVALTVSDLFAGLQAASFDIIVSNPPYVDAVEMEALAPEFRHEPALGLAGGKSGLDAVLRILRDAPHYLAEDGILVVEVGASQAALCARLPQVPFTWLEFERGGQGVFLLTRGQLGQYQALFVRAAIPGQVSRGGDASGGEGDVEHGQSQKR